MAKVVQRLIRGYVPAACNIYSRLRLYKCFVESRICQMKFILKWLRQKGQTKKETNKPTNLGLLRYWTLWDWVGKEFEFVTTWPPMLVCLWLQLFFFFFHKNWTSIESFISNISQPITSNISSFLTSSLSRYDGTLFLWCLNTTYGNSRWGISFRTQLCNYLRISNLRN